MPSPLGHALAGIGAGLLVRRPGSLTAAAGRRWFERPLGLALLLSAAACAPDLDLLWGHHNGPTHSAAAATLAGLAVLMWTRRPGLALAVAAAWGSHVGLDWLNRDDSPPFGIMALWPFSREHVIAPWPLLPPVSRRYWLPGFWEHTLKLALFELGLFGTFAAIVWWRRVRRPPA